MRPRFLGSLTFALVAGVATVAYAASLTSDGGYVFDPSDTDGSLSDGSSDAYDTAFTLSIRTGSTNAAYRTSARPATSLGGRQLDYPPVLLGDLFVDRHVYVPSTGGDYARFLDRVTNASAVNKTVEMTLYGNLGSDGSTRVMADSSGDGRVTADDAWFATDDIDGSGDPSLAFVMSGSSRSVGPSTASLSGDAFTWTYTFDVGPGETVAILSYAIQKRTQLEAQAQAALLAEGFEEAFDGLDGEIDWIRNFELATPGAPRIAFESPGEVDEGSAVEVRATVTAPEGGGDVVTWSWDLDDDGVFGESPGATSVTVDGSLLDGPTSFRVGIEATDGTTPTRRYRAIRVRNLPPSIDMTERPRELAGYGGTYSYQIVATDVPRDTLTYRIVSGPSTMSVSASGLVTWTTTESDITATGDAILVRAEVDDGDEGVSALEWSISVLANRAPTAPVPLYPVSGVGLRDRNPRLVAQNGEDFDYDELVYDFEVDTSTTFLSRDLQRATGVASTPGTTSWTVPTTLSAGLYHWRVRARDALLASDWREGTFFIVPTAEELADAGVQGGDASVTDAGVGDDAAATPTTTTEGGGCSVAGDDRHGAIGWLFAALAACTLYIRRKRGL